MKTATASVWRYKVWGSREKGWEIDDEKPVVHGVKVALDEETGLVSFDNLVELTEVYFGATRQYPLNIYHDGEGVHEVKDPNNHFRPVGHIDIEYRETP